MLYSRRSSCDHSRTLPVELTAELSLVTMADLIFTGNMCRNYLQLQPAAVEGFTSKRSKKSEKKVNFGKWNVQRLATMYCHT